ncbi:V-type proton ATPase subunit G-like [Nilaparvata lugens]|uniref:V-type proton ATPase subunit G-like n=1 Tax=Nilaparvata lugens TaxID=108931 RepID=UPI00193E6671|nr:V-type proton ATPase subunit G-like [Nilaparvata lugens]
MASQTQGIQQLLTVEKRAAEKVAEAKKKKVRRLKEVKEETQEEIEKYRAEREKLFREFEAKHMGSREDVTAHIEADTKIKIDAMNEAIVGTRNR